MSKSMNTLSMLIRNILLIKTATLMTTPHHHHRQCTV